ncbi:basic blue protein [Diospyros lotus]|uniref:basic blue protein n=1 Tax=Diospyros lotus TaxID=55363 RepID=UPI00225386C1|nr:basic blue protein [Diospyros lotus]
MQGTYRFFFSLVLVGLISTRGATAAQHVVGGSQGWDESTDFASWASGQTFRVGDQLVFKYTPGLHSVVELGSESAYKNCDVSSALNSLNGGNDAVKLNKAGDRYFACGTAGHCGSGMKLKITTVAANAPSTPASSSSPSSSGSSSTSPTSAGQESRSLGSLLVLMAASLVISLVLVF